MNTISLLTTTPFPSKIPTTTPHFPNPPPHSTATPSSPLTSATPKKFSGRDAFPDSLPLHTKNPHAIHRDIQRLARLGKLKQCLTILDYLDHRGIPVNPTTFSALLAACSRSKSLPLGRQIHVHIRINGLQSNEFIQSRLIQMYAACGSPEDAKKVLSDLSPMSVYPWNALLKGNVLGGKRWTAGPVETFSEMRELGVDVNEYTFSCMIKSFAGSPAFAQGMKAHALLIKNGFYDGSVLLKTGLIDMYFKCGKVRWAMKVFDEISDRDVVLWGAVIAGFAHNKLRREALEYMRWMGSEGIEPNSVVITTILPVIGDLAERKLGREIHGYVLKHFRDYKKLVFIQSGLIDMYCKCGDMVSGRHIFYGSIGRNVVSWTALMSGYASNGRFEQALRSIVWMQQEGIKPDVVSIATVLPVCTQLKALRQGKEIHGHVLKNWFLPNVSISTSLMTMYSECGKVESSQRVFGEMKKKNVIAWTALIDSYIKNGYLINALEVFRSMQAVNHRPDAIALARVLSVSGDLGAVRIGKEIHGQVYKMNLESIPLVVAEIVKMYGKCRETENAKKVFDGAPSKGSLTWTAIIEAYGSSDKFREAIDLFDRMRSNGFFPNHFTFDAILAMCNQAGLVEEALDVFGSMVHEYKLKASEEHCDCIIGLLNRSGRASEAQRFVHFRSSLAQM